MGLNISDESLYWWMVRAVLCNTTLKALQWVIGPVLNLIIISNIPGKEIILL
jgi:hypothetical protein